MVMEAAREAWHAYKRNFRTFMAAVILLMGIIYGIMGIGFAFMYFLNASVLGMAMLMVFCAIAVAFSFPLSGGFIKMCVEALKKTTGVRTMFSTAKEGWKKFIGIGLIVMALVMVPYLLFLAPLMALSSDPLLGAQSIGLMFILIALAMMGYVIMLVAALLVSFSFTTAVVDNLKAVAAVKRSYSFARANFLSVIALFVILSMMMFAVALVPLLVIFMILQLLLPSLTFFNIYIAMIIGMLIAMPLEHLAITSFYMSNKKSFDVRKAKRR